MGFEPDYFKNNKLIDYSGYFTYIKNNPHNFVAID